MLKIWFTFVLISLFLIVEHSRQLHIQNESTVNRLNKLSSTSFSVNLNLTTEQIMNLEQFKKSSCTYLKKGQSTLCLLQLTTGKKDPINYPAYYP